MDGGEHDMSILIKGIEMPKCCDACKFVTWSNLNQTAGCYLVPYDVMCFKNYSTEYRTKRSDYCPLVPVPPHGRLIDADAVTLEGGPYEYDDWCKWALEQYLNAPTTIPASEEGE